MMNYMRTTLLGISFLFSSMSGYAAAPLEGAVSTEEVDGFGSPIGLGEKWDGASIIGEELMLHCLAQLHISRNVPGSNSGYADAAPEKSMDGDQKEGESGQLVDVSSGKVFKAKRFKAKRRATGQNGVPGAAQGMLP